jgi:hypothetical protein
MGISFGLEVSQFSLKDGAMTETGSLSLQNMDRSVVIDT